MHHICPMVPDGVANSAQGLDVTSPADRRSPQRSSQDRRERQLFAELTSLMEENHLVELRPWKFTDHPNELALRATRSEAADEMRNAQRGIGHSVPVRLIEGA